MTDTSARMSAITFRFGSMMIQPAHWLVENDGITGKVVVARSGEDTERRVRRNVQ